MHRLRRSWSVATVAFAAGLGMPAAAPAQESGAAMIVVDGSGSMAGLIEPSARQSKIALVRDALRTALVQVGPQTRIGLAGFGHRHGGCNDVEIIRPPEPANAERTAALFGRIKPKGKGALVLAVREAARQLPDAAQPRSVVLIHDGADNCQQDVCAAASELGAAGVAVHVVSLGLPAEELAKMACLPQATGGVHFKADSGEQAAAAIVDALRLASGELAATALAPAALATPPIQPWTTAVVPPAPVPAARRSALHLSALAAPGAEPLAAPLQWTVASAEEPDALLFDAVTANPVVPVGPGSYIVTVRSELVAASQPVMVQDGRPVAVPIVLGSGTMRVKVAAQKSNAPLADAIVTVSTAEGAPLAVFKAAEAAALLPPGRFRVSADLGLVRTEQTVTVVQGRTSFIDLILNVGRLQLAAAGRDGAGQGEAVLFIVTEDDPPRGRREVARSAASQTEFALPPGTYYITARQGSVEARERLEIGAGDVVRRTLTAATGRLGLSGGSAGAIKLAGQP
jgi:Ca-activated chloride channel family protein